MAAVHIGLVALFIYATCSAQTTRGNSCNPQRQSVKENIKDVLLWNCSYDSGPSCKVTQIFENATPRHVNVSGLIEDPLQSNVWTYSIFLIRALDFEQLQVLPIDLTTELTCGGSVETTVQSIKLIVEDEKDTPPSFSNSTYTARVLENLPSGSNIIWGINAADPDSLDSFNYTINLQQGQSALFEVRTNGSITENLDVYLKSNLDFETAQRHDFTIVATDSTGMTATCQVIVEVLNVQDTPPAFSALQYNGRVSEKASLGTTVLTVSAWDGDTADQRLLSQGAAPNDLHFSISEGGAGMFAVNHSTGAIITSSLLDIDNNTSVTNGLVVMTIKAEELNNTGQPQYGVSTATVQVLIQIEDANDNRPKFNAASYSGTIREDAALDEVVAIENGGYISVVDSDQSPSNNRFSIHLEKEGQPWQLLKTNIDSQYAQASLLIQLNQEGGLMGMGDKHITFQIVVQEISNQAQALLPVRADMTVWVRGRTIPAPAPEPVINLPLTTSDVIVFIVGILLLLNIGLTIFICYALRGGRRNPFTVFNRNSKYYVSAKKKPGSDGSNNAGNAERDGPTDISRVENGEASNKADGHVETKLQNASVPGPAQPHVNTVTSAANRNRCDLTTVEDKVKASPDDIGLSITNSEESQRRTSQEDPVNEIKDSQEKSQTALLKVLTESESPTRCDVTPFERLEGIKDATSRSGSKDYEYVNISNVKPATMANTPQKETEKKQDVKVGDEQTQDQCDIIPIEQSPSSLGQGLSNLLQKVHRKLAQGNKFDQGKEESKCDLRPLKEEPESLESSFSSISQTPSNTSTFSEKVTGDVVPLIKSSSANRSNNKTKLHAHQNPAYESGEKVDGKGKKNSKDSSSNFTLLPGVHLQNKSDKDKDATPLKSKTSADNERLMSSSLLPQNPAKSQMIQTGVPAVALALPTSGSQYQESYTVVVNPVYDSVSHDNKRMPPAPPTKQPVTDTSVVYTTKINHPTTPLIKRPDGSGLLGMSTPARPNSEPNVSGSDKLSRPHELSKQTSVVEEIKRLHSSNNSPRQERNAKSMSDIISDQTTSQDYMAAAKNLLSAVKQEHRPQEKSQTSTRSSLLKSNATARPSSPKSVTINENKTGVEVPNPEEKLTSL